MFGKRQKRERVAAEETVTEFFRIIRPSPDAVGSSADPTELLRAHSAAFVHVFALVCDRYGLKEAAAERVFALVPEVMADMTRRAAGLAASPAGSTRSVQKNRGEPVARRSRLAAMDRVYLMLVCTAIVALVTALALSAPKGPQNGQPDATVLANGEQK